MVDDRLREAERREILRRLVDGLLHLGVGDGAHEVLDRDVVGGGVDRLGDAPAAVGLRERDLAVGIGQGERR